MTVRIRRKLESETLHLPELLPLIGKNVEIIVLEDPQATVSSEYDDWHAAVKKAQELDDYDFDVLIPGDASRQARMPESSPSDALLEEFDRLLDEFSGGPALPYLADDFSRADIYPDRD